jgi:hypothetical protein
MSDEGEGTGGEDAARPRSLLLAVPALLMLSSVLDASLSGGSDWLMSGVDSGERDGLITLRDSTAAVRSVALRRTMLSVMSESVGSSSSSSWVSDFPPPATRTPYRPRGRNLPLPQLTHTPAPTVVYSSCCRRATCPLGV